MFFFNLTAAEFFAMFGVLSTLVTVLYLLDRSRRKVVVPSLRFWQQSEIPSQRKHRRRIQQPLSLLLQLLAITLLLLAIAQLRLGSPDRSSRDHVLLLDTSAWMSAQGTGGRPLMDEVRTAALRYLRALPSADRVMIVRADALATPITGFESNRGTLQDAVRQIQPGTAALNLTQSFDFATQALRLAGKRTGEIVYAGAGRLNLDSADGVPTPPANLRYLSTKTEVENTGLRKLSVRRSATDPEVWEIYVTVRNYGTRPRSIPLLVAFGGAPVGTRRLSLAPGQEVSSNFEFRTKAAGWIEARIDARDGLPSDDSTTLELPSEKTLRVAVYSSQPELLRPLLAANRRVEATFLPPTQYQPDNKADIVILDRFKPTTAVDRNALWIEPPQASSPIAVRGLKQNATIHWRSEQVLAAGLRTKDSKIEETQIFSAAPSDITVAATDGAPVILARPGKYKTAVFGFHPMRTALRYELATPLLFANILKWMAPDIFLRVELQAATVGTVALPLDGDYDPAQIRVVADPSTPIPFTVRDRTLRFFTGLPGMVRIYLGDRELVYSQSLPQIGESRWEPPKSVRTGFAGVGGLEAAARDIWQWLALAAALLLIAEWAIFGRGAQSGQNAGIVLPFLKREEPRRKAS